MLICHVRQTRRQIDRAIYDINRTIKEVEKDFGNELDIIYVNGSNRDDTEPGRLIHDRNCREAKDMYREVLAARVYMLKEPGEGIEIMCKELQELYELYDEGVKGQVCDMNSIFHRISVRKYESREVEQDSLY